MPFLRWLPLCFALVSVSGTNCRKSDPTDKPVAAPEISIAGVDTSPLTPRERRDWSGQVTELLAPCPDTPVSIAQCVKEQRGCKTCLPAAQFLLKQVQAGKPKKEREDAYHARFDPSKVKTLSTEGSPEKGSPDAVVTIVEWADFECPFCRLVYPLLEELTVRFAGQVRVIFKFYPLSGHPHGEIAARAAVAAMNQGKFWEMHHLLFDNQDKLEQADLERYAKQLNLDMVKYKADFSSKETGLRIEKDMKQADQIGLEGTPLLYISGREVDLKLLGNNPYEDLESWVKLDIELAGKVPQPASSAKPSAPVGAPSAPSGSSSAGPAKMLEPPKAPASAEPSPPTKK
jgi:protein-disulfide isomerase